MEHFMRKVFISLATLSLITFSNFAVALEDTKENRIKVAEKLIAETITSDFVNNMTNSTWAPLEKNLKKLNPHITAEILATMKQNLAEQQKTLMAEVMSDMPTIYAQYFTSDELEAIYKFQTSPVGRKSIAVTPKIMAQIMPKIFQSIQKNTPKIMENMKKRAKEKGLKL